jgi:Phage integrase family
MHIGGAKNGTPATHPLSGREMRELRRHQRESVQSPFVFVSERGAPLSAPGFCRMIERAAIAADLGIKAHAHMLRHACGYKLANDGHDTARSRPISGIAIFRTRRATPPWRRSGSRSFFGIDRCGSGGRCPACLFSTSVFNWSNFRVPKQTLLKRRYIA